MPAIIKVKVIEGKDLPVMDRASDLTDAFVELRLGSVTFKTDVCRKTLNPVWDSEWFKFEVDDEELQEEYLQLKVLDYDVYSSHDAIGKVNINLDLLALKDGTNEMGGFFPIYDTLHGIRGHIKIKIRVQLFLDKNKYRQTSCGIRFFSSTGVPTGYAATNIYGLVDELLVDDDPEYQWIDKIRTPRASNEARQRLFTKLGGEVKRKIGLKVLEAGGNAVIGYQQHYDLEGETGIVVRGVGTSVSLVTKSDNLNTPFVRQNSPEDLHPNDIQNRPIQRLLSQTRCSLSVSSESDNAERERERENPESARPPQLQRLKTYIEEKEYPFFTITNPPPGFVLHLGGIVSSRSVKLLDKVKDPDSETRDMWWKELRSEIRSHTRALGCHAVLGYTEYTTICDDLIVLSASGTAAVLRENDTDEKYISTDGLADIKKEEIEFNDQVDTATRRVNQQQPQFDFSTSPNQQMVSLSSCHLCHVPYSDADLPLPINLGRCMFCRHDKVPDVLFSTIDLPEDLPVTGRGCMIQATVIRWKKKDKDETNAENVSQILPFLEFDLHQQLINKLKMKAMNAVFGMKTKLSIGEQAITGMMTGTAVYLKALPPPPMLLIAGRAKSTDNAEKHIGDIQKRLIEITTKNQTLYLLNDELDKQQVQKSPYHEEPRVNGHQKNGRLDFAWDGKDTYILEIDDQSDSTILPLLSDSNHQGCFIFNTNSSPGFPLFKQDHQFFSSFTRVKMPQHGEESQKASLWLSNTCQNLIMGIYLKARHIMPCCFANTTFSMRLEDDDFIQITVTTYAMKIDEHINKPFREQRAIAKSTSSLVKLSNDNVNNRDQGIGNLKGGKIDKRKKVSSFSLSLCASWPRGQFSSFLDHVVKCKAQASQSLVTICPLDNIPNTNVASYLGHIEIFLIRESTSIKEDGGLQLFTQTFMTEIHAIVKAHVLSLGGNALLSFHLEEFILFHSPHKNQVQCLINVSGDAADVTDSSDAYDQFFQQFGSSSSSISSSPVTPKPPELMEEIKYKLDRAVFGTNV